MQTNPLARFGPGMMLAAAAIGVSHLVMATRAGAEYGFSYIWLIVLIVILKYPAFRFAVDYASATGRSLVTGIAAISSIARAWLVVAFFVDMFIATAAVALVTAGLFISVFRLPFSGPQVAVGITVISALILLNGQYRKAEWIVKVLVILFSVLTLAATLFALPLIGSDGRDVFAAITPSRSMALFVIAVAGWMPMPTTGAIFQSMWVCEKRRSGAGHFEYAEAKSDLHVGYSLTLLLAIAFLVMGTAVLFQTDRVVPASAGAFATEFLSIFTTVLGNWMYPIIAAAALAVMWSSLVALLDAIPRVADRLLGILTGRADDAPRRYTMFLSCQVAGVALILFFLMQTFGTFIAFATSMGFLAAPAIAYYNYRAVTSASVIDEFRPDRHLVTWNWISIITLAGFALFYFVLRIT